MSLILSVDFETFYSTKLKYGIKQLGMHAYCDHELFDPYLIAVSTGIDSWAGEPHAFNWNLFEGATLVSHNAAFDSYVYETMVRRGMAPRVNYARWLCTADMTSFLCNERALDNAVFTLLGVQLDKSVRADADGKTSKELKADVGGWKRMLAYGRSDAFRCVQLFLKFGHLWPEHERELAILTRRQGARGLQIDVQKLGRYIAIATQMLQQAESVLPWVDAGRPPTSPKAIAEECTKVGIPAPPVKSREGEDAFLEWEAAYSAKHPWIANVANWRSINKFLESLLTIKQRLRPDGVVPFSLKYWGAHTGRWSGDAGLNLQNLRKEPIYRDDKGFMVSEVPRLMEIAKAEEKPSWVTAELDIRSLIIPRSGKQMIISDLSQIEPRVLAWLVDDQDMLRLMASGQSPYEAHARATMGFAGGNMKKEDKEGYALAKARVLGLGYRCGWKKFILVAQIMAGLDITKDDPKEIPVFSDETGEPILNADGTQKMRSGYGETSKRIVQDYRNSNPKIVGLWEELDAEFRSKEGGTFEMHLPSGRSLRYQDVRREWRTVVDEETGISRRRLVYTAMLGGLRRALHGGLLAENAVQAIARDVFGFHCLELDRTAGIDVLFGVHDEAVNECDLDVQPKDVEAIMSRCPDWLEGCPLAAEAQVAPHYKK